MARKPPGEEGNRVRAVESIDAVQPVNVDVDEPRGDDVPPEADVPGLQ